MTDIPKGITAIVHWPDGRVLASASDFAGSEANGFTTLERQRSRARAAVCREAMRKTCHSDFSGRISQYHLEELIGDLIRQDGYSISYLAHGYPEDQTPPFERERRR